MQEGLRVGLAGFCEGKKLYHEKGFLGFFV
jgi:hypothetical protein